MMKTLKGTESDLTHFGCDLQMSEIDTEKGSGNMKRSVVAGVIFLMTISAIGQGTVEFVNRSPSGVIAQVTVVSPGGRVGLMDGVPYPGAKWEAQLFGGPEGGALVALTPKTTFRTGAGAGYIVSVFVPIPGVAPGERASLQMKAFTIDGLYSGSSKVFSLTVGSGPFPPAPLHGLESFSVTVPEPSTIALGILGAVGLCLMRRAKYVNE
jgi:hypothetical protein